jgi:archaemetzincin
MRAESEPAAFEALHILPLGPLQPSWVANLAERLSRRVRLPCHVTSMALGTPLPRLPERDQLDADRVLAALESLAPPRVVVVGMTPLDMAIPIFTFVFGRARQRGNAALVALARLDPGFHGLPRDPDLLADRAVAEILHELGHVASLRHCSDPACVMAFAASVEKIDSRGTRFCAACAARLPAWLAMPPVPRALEAAIDRPDGVREADP